MVLTLPSCKRKKEEVWPRGGGRGGLDTGGRLFKDGGGGGV